MAQNKRSFSISIALTLAAGALIANACSSDNSNPAPGGAGAGGASGSSGHAGASGKGGAAGEGGVGAANSAGDTGVTPIAGAAGEAGASGVESYTATLSGAEEVPPVATAALGSATFTYDPVSRLLSWTLTQNVVGATAAHIHDAAAGENNPTPLIPLAITSPTSGSATLTAAQESELRLGHLYANVHSPTSTAGEIRGQILRPGDSLWVAQLTGAEEVPTNTSKGTGVSSLIVNAAHTSAHYRLTTTLTPTIAHIHTGIAGVSGPIRIPFTLSGASAEADVAFTEADFTALNQTQLYANVHTAMFMPGEIRGQLLHPGSTLFAAKMTGDQEVPALTVPSTGTGNASVALDYQSSTVHYAVVTSLMPTAAHLHDGVYGVASPTPIFPFAAPLGPEFYGTGTLPTGEADALRAGRLYANVHTALNPGGEIRGQLIQPGEHIYTASLTGANEVPPTTSTATGQIQFVLNVAGDTLRYQSLVTGLADATASHIHTGLAGIAGPVLYPLTLIHPSLNPTGTQAVTAADVTILNASPSAYYANIHSTLYMNGEIRGQIVAH